MERLDKEGDNCRGLLFVSNYGGGIRTKSKIALHKRRRRQQLRQQH